MVTPLNLIVAVCENFGIGKNGNLPWRLKTEMEYFTKMTTTCKDVNKKNVVLMGRKTWDSIPTRYKPLKNRINFVLSRSNMDLKEYKDVYHFKDLKSAVEKLEDESFKKLYETIWVVGGSQIYDMCMRSEHFQRLYITTVMKNFECDTFFPKLPDGLKKVTDPNVPEGVQTEGDTQYVINIYENPKFST